MEIEDEPKTSTCSGCDAPIRWLYSGRRKRWVAFSPHPTDTGALKAHEHPPTPQQDWREPKPRASNRAFVAAARDAIAAAIQAEKDRRERTGTR